MGKAVVMYKEMVEEENKENMHVLKKLLIEDTATSEVTKSDHKGSI